MVFAIKRHSFSDREVSASLTKFVEKTGEKVIKNLPLLIPHPYMVEHTDYTDTPLLVGRMAPVISGLLQLEK